MKIPFMDVIQISQYYKTIRPIRRLNGSACFLRELTNEELTKISYIWLDRDSIKEPVDMEKLFVLKELDMLHVYSFYGHFKPSVGEIIAQIPRELINQVVAFEIIKQPERTDDFDLHIEEFKAGFHVSTIRLYSNKV